MKTVFSLIVFLCFLLFNSCSEEKKIELNIGFIGPLTGNAVDLGLPPSKAIRLAIEDYVKENPNSKFKINYFEENDLWDKKNAIPLYEKLRKLHKIDILFMSHSDGTIQLQERIKRDNVILVNPINNDYLLSKLNENTFKIGKKTEEAGQIVASRVKELGLKNIYGFHVTNTFMTIFSNAFANDLVSKNTRVKITPVSIDKTDFENELKEIKKNNPDALVFFGYKNLGFAMKQARDLGIKCKFFGATTLLGKGFYENSEGSMVDTEFSYFTENDGNYILANSFLEKYKKKYKSLPMSVWPALQAYDAASIVLSIVKKYETIGKESFKIYDFREDLINISHFQGTCGNIAILRDGSSRGIYFSLYRIKDMKTIEKVKRK